MNSDTQLVKPRDSNRFSFISLLYLFFRMLFSGNIFWLGEKCFLLLKYSLFSYYSCIQEAILHWRKNQMKKKKKKMRNQGRTHPIPKVSFLVPFNFIEGSFITLEYAIHSSFWRTPGHSQILWRFLKFHLN